jgi:hypothetical protein
LWRGGSRVFLCTVDPFSGFKHPRCAESSILIDAGAVPALIEETTMTSLRQQMTDAMVLRGFAARTQEAYLACVVALARHYRRPPDTLTTDELQAYLLHLITERKQAYASVNQAACASPNSAPCK